MDSDYEYFSKRSVLSKSSIDLLLECAAKFRAFELGATEEEESDAMKFGSLTHCLALQPEKFSTRYLVSDLSLASKEGKALKEDAEEQGLKIIKNKEYESAMIMADAVRSHPQIKLIFEGKEYTPEEPLYWTYEGVDCKCKPDVTAIAPNGARYCLDLKTTQEADPKFLYKSILKFNYHRQAAWYLYGLQACAKPCESFIFAFVEKTPPYLVTACELDEQAIALGWRDCQRAVTILNECRKTGIYPCYTKNIETISLPKWAFTEENEYA